MTNLLERRPTDIAAQVAEMPLARVIEQLKIAIGEYLSVITSGAPDAATLQAWQDGAVPPPHPERLQFSLEIVRRLSVDHSNGQIHAWFGTVVPEFDEMPARVIALRPVAEIRARMLRALPHDKKSEDTR